MKRTCAALVGALCAAVGPAGAATELPRYDVEAYCETVARATGGRSALLFNNCITAEQAGYDAVKARWSAVAPDAAAYCIGIADMVGRSYEALSRCVDQEGAAAAAPVKTFKP